MQRYLHSSTVTSYKNTSQENLSQIIIYYLYTCHKSGCFGG